MNFSGWNWSQKRREALAVVAAALILRVGYIGLQGAPAPLAGDSLEYRAYARSVAATARFEGLDGLRGNRMPGYPLFLTSVEALFGPSTRAVQWMQCLLGALTCLFIYAWARELLRPPWPLACGLAAACYYDLIAPAGWVLSESLYSLLLAAAFFFLYFENLSVRRRAVLGGLGLGLAYGVRPEVMPLAVVILGASFFILKGFTRRDSLLALAAFMAIVSLWIGRNALVFRRFIPAGVSSGYNLYLGLRLPLDHQGLDLGPLHRSPAGLGELERDADYLRAYHELLRTVPLRRRVKAYAFNLLTVYYPFLPQYDWTYVILIPFWVFGLWTALSRREWWPPAILVAGVSAAFAFLAGPVSRYRFGFSPCLILLAGFGAQSLEGRQRGPRIFYRSAAIWAAANMALWLGAVETRQAALQLKAWLWG